MMFDPAFIGLAALTIATSILALESREMIYGAVSLGLSFLGVAGLFILLDAPFLAAFQIVIYVGAVAVLILFTVMLVRREKWLQLKEDKGRVAGLLGALALALGIGIVALASGLASWLPGEAPLSFVQIGGQLIMDYWLALEVLALLLAVSVLGALTLAKLEKE